MVYYLFTSQPMPESSAHPQRVSADQWRSLTPDARRDALRETWSLVAPIIDQYRTATAAQIQAAIVSATSQGRPDDAEALRLLLDLRNLGPESQH